MHKGAEKGNPGWQCDHLGLAGHQLGIQDLRPQCAGILPLRGQSLHSVPGLLEERPRTDKSAGKNKTRQYLPDPHPDRQLEPQYEEDNQAVDRNR